MKLSQKQGSRPPNPRALSLTFGGLDFQPNFKPFNPNGSTHHPPCYHPPRSSPRLPFDPMHSAAMRGTAAAAPALSAQSAGSPERPLTISQANTLLSHALAAALPAQFFVQGEISNFKASDRGHAYFTLKDAAAELPCILWKDGMQRLKFKPTDGLAVMARGGVRLYEPQGKDSAICRYVSASRHGAAPGTRLRQLWLPRWRRAFSSQQRKRPIPRVPSHVVIITSRTGSVLHDVLITRPAPFPGLRVSLFSVRVQGDGAAGQVVRAIRCVNEHARRCAWRPRMCPPDLILLVRGGGSLEDLWAFNEEILAGHRRPRHPRHRHRPRTRHHHRRPRRRSP